MLFINYCITASIILLLLSAFYWLLLRRETFFGWNRMVLLTIICFTCLLPLLPIPQISFYSNDLHEAQQVLNEITQALETEVISTSILQESNEQLNPTKSATSVTSIDIILFVYWIGLALFSFRFFIQLLSILQQIRKADINKGKRYHLASIQKDIAPFSFGKYIFLNPSKYNEEQFEQILQHEKVHVRFGHTYDILLAECFTIFFWFNPFAWLVRHFINQNIEFQVDQTILDQGEDRKVYQYHLLQIAVPNFPLSITTNYNQSLIKNRVIMMNQKKSSLNVALKYLLLLPFTVLVMAGINARITQFPSSFTTEMSQPVNISQFEEGDAIYFIMSFNISMAEIERAMKDLEKYGLKMTIKDMERDGKGNISSISITIKDEVGSNSNSFSSSGSGTHNKKMYIYRTIGDGDSNMSTGSGDNFDNVREVPPSIRTKLNNLKSGYLIGEI
ncbi:MAG: M56 family metallopeptidase [Bacteroidota bacterium]